VTERLHIKHELTVVRFKMSFETGHFLGRLHFFRHTIQWVIPACERMIAIWLNIFA